MDKETNTQVGEKLLEPDVISVRYEWRGKTFDFTIRSISANDRQAVMRITGVKYTEGGEVDAAQGFRYNAHIIEKAVVKAPFEPTLDNFEKMPQAVFDRLYEEIELFSGIKRPEDKTKGFLSGEVSGGAEVKPTRKSQDGTQSS